MKRWKNDGEMTKPMFPRLHVNDTEKRGPKAPPRNKMALYEQLSIPSQRFNPSVCCTGSFVPQESASQSAGSHGNFLGSSDVCTLTSVRPEKVLDSDDSSVPVPVHLELGQYHAKPYCINSDKPSTFLKNTLPDHSMNNTQTIDVCCRDSKQLDYAGEILALDVKNPCVNNGDSSRCSSTNFPVAENIDGDEEDENASSNQHYKAHAACLRGLEENDVCVTDLSKETDKGNVSCQIGDSRSSGAHGCPNELETRRRCCGGMIHGLLPLGNGENIDDCSEEASMVDSVSACDISPDDVVEIIGPKHFWKARKAMINQQRVFAIQVFELHRLIKVQRLIAGSPHLLIKDSNFLTRPPLEKASEDVIHTGECSIDNNDGPCPSNGPALPTSSDMMGPWHFYQSLGQQWLIPIMSPSEGLIYKPFALPGFLGPFCSTSGPLGQPSFLTNFIHPCPSLPTTFPCGSLAPHLDHSSPCEPPRNGSSQLGKVIKVEPHNRGSTTESAARIFQSIQDERKMHVSK